MTNLKIKIGPKGVATATLNRPEIHNAFDEELIASLIREISKLEKDPTVKIVALMG
ncbi:MAG: enoyl-CoA hydratase-related protein, partial [Bacteriovoracales bacterium]